MKWVLILSVLASLLAGCQTVEDGADCLMEGNAESHDDHLIDSDTDDINDPLNPNSPLNPNNPLNPNSPLNPNNPLNPNSPMNRMNSMNP